MFGRQVANQTSIPAISQPRENEYHQQAEFFFERRTGAVAKFTSSTLVS